VTRKTIQGVEIKPGAKGPYKRVNWTDGKGANLFDDKLIGIAEANVGSEVEVNFVESNGYWNVESIMPIGGQPQAPSAPQTASQPPSSPSGYDLKDRSVCLSYGKDIVQSLIHAKIIKDKDEALVVMQELGQGAYEWLKGEEPEKTAPKQPEQEFDMEEDPMAGLGDMPT